MYQACPEISQHMWRARRQSVIAAPVSGTMKLPKRLGLFLPTGNAQCHQAVQVNPIKSCVRTSARLLPGAKPRLVMNWGSDSIRSLLSREAISSSMAS